MNTVVIGPGRIGCGFAGQLLRSSGHRVTFLGRNAEVVDHLNRLGHYRVRLANGRDSRDIVVDEVRAVYVVDEAAALAALAEADLIVTAVGAGNLPAVAPLIAAALAGRGTPANVFAFENLADAGTYLKALVASHLPADGGLERHGFSGSVVSRAVSQRLGDPTADAPLTFVGDPASAFVVSGPDLRPLEPIEGMIVADDLAAWMKHKLYIFSAGHAACAYLGYLKGYHYIHTAIRDPEIRAAVLAAMREGQRGVAALYGAPFAGGEADLLEILARFENAALQDTVNRVGRDPTRKLGHDDRLLGAAQLAQDAGLRPAGLGLAAAAACCFDPEDPSAAQLQSEIENAGLGSALQRVSGLDTHKGLGRLVRKSWTQLAQGWRKDNVLLSLAHLLWAWKPEQGGGAAHQRKGWKKNAKRFESHRSQRHRLAGRPG